MGLGRLEPRGERPGLHERHTDAEGPHLVAQALGPALHGVLGGAVAREAGNPGPAPVGGDEDELAAAPGAHPRQRASGHRHRAEEVRLELRAERLGEDLLRGAEVGHARVVDHGVHRAESRLGLAEGPVDGGRLRDVEAEREEVLRRREGDGFGLPGRGHHAPAALQRESRRQKAEPARGARDEDGLGGHGLSLFSGFLALSPAPHASRLMPTTANPSASPCCGRPSSSGAGRARPQASTLRCGRGTAPGWPSRGPLPRGRRRGG